MARGIGTNAVISKIRLQEQASNPASPDSGYAFLFFKADGIYLRFDDGTVAGPFGVNVSVGGTLGLTGDISPAQITANQNDYAPTGLSGAAVLRLSSDASRNLTGLAGGADGRILILHNVGAQNIVLKDEDAASVAANRFALTADVTLTPDTVVMLQYDATSSRWRVIGGTGSGAVSDGDKGDITVSGGGAVWTIDSGVVTFAKMQAISDGSLLGASGGTAIEEIAVGTGLQLAADTLSSTITQYIDEQAQDAVGTILSDAGDVDFTYDDATPAISAVIKNDAVTYAKMQNVSAASRLLGRGSAGGAGDVQEMTVGAGLSISGTELAATGTAAVLDVNVTEVGNVGTGEDDLITYSVAGNTLDTNEQYLHFVAAGSFAANGNNKRVRVYLGATLLFDTGAVAFNGADWVIEGWIVREAAAVQKCLVKFNSSSALLAASSDYVGAAEDLTGALTLKLTGEATSNDDIVQETFVCEKGGGAGGGGGAPTDATYIVEDANGSLSAEAVLGTTVIETAAFASLTAAAKAGRLKFPNDSFYILRDSGSALAPWGPIFPMTLPIDGDFAWVNQGGASVVATNGGIFLSIAAAGTDVNNRIRKKAAPSTPYVITAAFIPYIYPASGANGNGQCGLCFRESSSGKLSSIMILGNGQLEVQKWNSPSSFSASYFQNSYSYLVSSGTLWWFQIADDGATRYYRVSNDGVNFRTIHSVGRTDFLTADEVGFCINVDASAKDTGMTLLSWKQG